MSIGTVLDSVFQGLVAFFDDQFLGILVATAGLFLIMLITWWVYRKLSQRNLFSLFTEKVKKPTGWDHFVYGMKYFLLFPVIVFAGFLIFAFSLFILVKPQSAELETGLLFIAIVIVSTIRVSAYVNESMAEDLAKLIPLSLLGIVFTQGLSGFGIGWDQITGFALLIPGFLKYLLFTIILEGMLRGSTWIISNLNTSVPAASDDE